MKLKSLPGFGTSEISRWLNVVAISELSVCSSGASPETSTVTPVAPTSSFAFTTVFSPTLTVVVELVVLKLGAVIVTV